MGEAEPTSSGWTIGTFKELVDERFAAEQRALELLGSETHRRLDELNHAHQQAVEKERDFIGREAFDTFTSRTADDFQTLRTEINGRIVPLEKYVTGQQGGPRNITTASVAAIIAGVAIAAGLYFGFTNQSTNRGTTICSAAYHPSPCPQ